jgi:hypothetical protein
VSQEPTTVAPRTDGSEETLGGELDAELIGRLGAVVVVVGAEVVVVGAGLVVVVLGDAGVVVTAAAVVVAGGGGGPADTPIEVVSGPLPAQGLPIGTA